MGPMDVGCNVRRRSAWQGSLGKGSLLSYTKLDLYIVALNVRASHDVVFAMDGILLGLQGLLRLASSGSPPGGVPKFAHRGADSATTPPKVSQSRTRQT